MTADEHERLFFARLVQDNPEMVDMTTHAWRVAVNKTCKKYRLPPAFEIKTEAEIVEEFLDAIE